MFRHLLRTFLKFSHRFLKIRFVRFGRKQSASLDGGLPGSPRLFHYRNRSTEKLNLKPILQNLKHRHLFINFIFSRRHFSNCWTFLLKFITDVSGTDQCCKSWAMLLRPGRAVLVWNFLRPGRFCLKFFQGPTGPTSLAWPQDLQHWYRPIFKNKLQMSEILDCTWRSRDF